MSRHLIIAALFAAQLAAASAAHAKEVTVSPIGAYWDGTSRTQYSFTIGFPRDQINTPPKEEWTAWIPCGALVGVSKHSVFWDQAAVGKDGACTTFGEKDATISVHVFAVNGEHYFCTYKGGSRTGHGPECEAGESPLPMGTFAELPSQPYVLEGGVAASPTDGPAPTPSRADDAPLKHASAAKRYGLLATGALAFAIAIYSVRRKEAEQRYKNLDVSRCDPLKAKVVALREAVHALEADKNYRHVTQEVREQMYGAAKVGLGAGDDEGIAKMEKLAELRGELEEAEDALNACMAGRGPLQQKAKPTFDAAPADYTPSADGGEKPDASKDENVM